MSVVLTLIGVLWFMASLLLGAESEQGSDRMPNTQKARVVAQEHLKSAWFCGQKKSAWLTTAETSFDD